MTREEAIQVLNTYDVNFDEYRAEEIADAIDMAIEALNNSIQMSNIQQLEAENGVLKEMIKFYREQLTVDVVYCKDCIRNNDGNYCDIAFFINDDGDGFCNCGERKEP